MNALTAWIAALTLALASLPASGQVLTNCSAAGLAAALAEDGALVILQNCSIALSNSITISGSVSLLGSGTNASVDANSLSRIFHVLPNARLYVAGVTLTGGKEQHGAAVYVESDAQASFSNCVFRANAASGTSGKAGVTGSDSSGIGGNGQAGADGTNGLGGAIFNRGDVSVLRCSFVGNSATGGAGGAGGDGGSGVYQGGNGGRGGNGATARGGAIYNLGTLLVRDSSIEGNSARAGNGALGGESGAGPFPGTIGSGGFGARALGAGIYNDGMAQIINCSFLTNTATGGDSAESGSLNGGLKGGDGDNGGGALGGGLCNMNYLYATNCTFATNRAAGGRGANGGNGRYEAGDGGDGGEGYGGGIYNSGAQWLVNCTVSQNSVAGGARGTGGTQPLPASDGQRGPTLGAGIATTSSGQFQLLNSIISDNTGAGNGSGPFDDLGSNISSDGSVALGSQSLKKTSPRLASLADNGGPTLTMTLQVGSPAAQAGTIEGAPGFDQRGFPRPGPGKTGPDIGALEMQLPVITNQPASQLIAPGGTAIFTVGVQGDRPLIFTWSRNGTNIAGAAGATYTLTNITTALAGEYVVTVSNAVGSARSAPALLTVGSGPVITNQPISQIALVGTNILFTVGATGAPPLSVQWRSNGVAFAAWTNWTLLLSNVQPSYSADYSARITNSYAAVTSSIAHLQVISAPALVPNVISSGTNFALSFPTVTGLTYVTEFKNTLAAPTWIPLLTNLGTGSGLTNIDPITNLPSRFYRIRAQ